MSIFLTLPILWTEGIRSKWMNPRNFVGEGTLLARRMDVPRGMATRFTAPAWRPDEIHPRSFVPLHEKCGHRLTQDLCQSSPQPAQATAGTVDGWRRCDKKDSSLSFSVARGGRALRDWPRSVGRINLRPARRARSSADDCVRRRAVWRSRPSCVSRGQSRARVPLPWGKIRGPGDVRRAMRRLALPATEDQEQSADHDCPHASPDRHVHGLLVRYR